MSLESSSPPVTMESSATGLICQQESRESELGKFVSACEFYVAIITYDISDIFSKVRSE